MPRSRSRQTHEAHAARPSHAVAAQVTRALASVRERRRLLASAAAKGHDARQLDVPGVRRAGDGRGAQGGARDGEEPVRHARPEKRAGQPQGELPSVQRGGGRGTEGGGVMDLDELERLEKESPRGWTFRPPCDGDQSRIVDGLGYYVAENCKHDGAFIAALRNAAPELIAAARERERYRWRPMSEAPRDKVILVRGYCDAPETFWLEDIEVDGDDLSACEWTEIPE